MPWALGALGASFKEAFWGDMGNIKAILGIRLEEVSEVGVTPDNVSRSARRGFKHSIFEISGSKS